MGQRLWAGASNAHRGVANRITAIQVTVTINATELFVACLGADALDADQGDTAIVKLLQNTHQCCLVGKETGYRSPDSAFFAVLLSDYL